MASIPGGGVVLDDDEVEWPDVHDAHRGTLNQYALSRENLAYFAMNHGFSIGFQLRDGVPTVSYLNACDIDRFTGGTSADRGVGNAAHQDGIREVFHQQGNQKGASG